MATNAKRGRKPYYRWDEWFAAKDFSLTRGKDFRCSLDGMVQMIRSRAAERSLSVSINRDGAVVKVQVR